MTTNRKSLFTKEFLCRSCWNKWYENAPFYPTQCPSCGSLKVRWLNYEYCKEQAKKDNRISGFGKTLQGKEIEQHIDTT